MLFTDGYEKNRCLLTIKHWSLVDVQTLYLIIVLGILNRRPVTRF